MLIVLIYVTRLNDLRSIEPVALGRWGPNNKKQGSDLWDYEIHDIHENPSKLARMEESGCYPESQRYQTLYTILLYE